MRSFLLLLVLLRRYNCNIISTGQFLFIRMANEMIERMKKSDNRERIGRKLQRQIEALNI